MMHRNNAQNRVKNTLVIDMIFDYENLKSHYQKYYNNITVGIYSMQFDPHEVKYTQRTGYLLENYISAFRLWSIISLISNIIL